MAMAKYEWCRDAVGETDDHSRRAAIKKAQQRIRLFRKECPGQRTIRTWAYWQDIPGGGTWIAQIEIAWYRDTKEWANREAREFADAFISCLLAPKPLALLTRNS